MQSFNLLVNQEAHLRVSEDWLAQLFAELQVERKRLDHACYSPTHTIVKTFETCNVFDLGNVVWEHIIQ